MSPSYDPEIVAKALLTDRFAALVRTDLDIAAVETWDDRVLRDARLLVPVDVQALYVAPDDAEPMVRMPSQLRDAEHPMPPVFDKGAPRDPGIHLHWAMPDALQRGRLGDPAAGEDRLRLPVLPDRWVVIRLLAPRRAAEAHVRGWVLEADTARAVPLGDYPGKVADAEPAGQPVAREALTATAGGTLAWTASYDGVLNRFALVDPLDDVSALRDRLGEIENAATYVVAGWWSDPGLDPLDVVYAGENVHERITALGWTLTEGGSGEAQLRAVKADQRSVFDLASRARFAETAQATTDVEHAGTAVNRITEHAYSPASGAFSRAAKAIAVGPQLTPKATLLHGCVHGVPIRGRIKDSRPDGRALGLILGRHADDLAAGLAAPGLTDEASRRNAERLLTAFTGGLLRAAGTPDGVVEIEEREHAQGFASLPGGDRGVDRLLVGQSAPVTAYGRAGRTQQALAGLKGAAKVEKALKTRLAWSDTQLREADDDTARSKERQARLENEPEAADAEVRDVRRTAPRWFFPLDPLVAVTGADRTLRYGGDGRFSPDGMLHCRWPSHVVRALGGVLAGRDVVPTLGSGALPDEVLLLAREALLQSPYLTTWLAQAAEAQHRIDAGLVRARLLAEAALRFGANASYTGTSTAFASLAGDDAAQGSQTSFTSYVVAEQARRFSAFEGVDVDPVGVTAWRQPWLPLWLEWEVEIEPGAGPTVHALGALDLEPPKEQALGPPVRLTGRSLLSPGPATQLEVVMGRWLDDERARDERGLGETDDKTAARLAAVKDAVARLDVLSATLDGVREQLLALPYDGGFRRIAGERPVPTGPPTLLLSGRLRITRARLLDTFGRVLELDPGRVTVPVRSADAAEPAAVRLLPRLTRPARWMFRLVDAAATDPRPAEASVDQVDPAKQVLPVAGFVLPDHIDEALEVFGADGTPLGQLFHEPVGGGVVWEIAPGREGPADAGPGYGLTRAQAPLANMAAGLVAVDATVRGGLPRERGAESALSALLRVIDTTLWTYDPYASLGGEHVAGLVGRPLAVVRARLWLEVDDDLDELDLSDATRRAEREAAYVELAEHAFPVRVGELTRSDDGLIAFFVDDDYSRVRIVDKAVAQLARDSGRLRGYLGTYGSSAGVPAEKPVDHPYVAADDELRVHVGQVVTLTLLMQPGGAVHLTSGVLPRKALRLAREWVTPGLTRMAPSVRVGPVLVDPDKVRMPKVASLGADLTFTRRDSPYTWKNDPILAATQAALLPDVPAELQEGWIRVTPDEEAP